MSTVFIESLLKYCTERNIWIHCVFGALKGEEETNSRKTKRPQLYTGLKIKR